MQLFKSKNKKNNMDIENENTHDENVEQQAQQPETEQPQAEQTEQTEPAEAAQDQQPETEQPEPDKKKKRHGHRDEAAEKVQELGEKLADMTDRYQRMYAEYENYRKRTTMEKAELILNGGKEVMKSILPTIDDLERALAAMTDENSREGVQLILNKLLSTLQQKGLKPMEAKGAKFDENLHEAVTQFPAPSEEQKGTVIDVVEKGYFLNDKVLRYAKVVVAI